MSIPDSTVRAPVAKAGGAGAKFAGAALAPGNAAKGAARSVAKRAGGVFNNLAARRRGFVMTSEHGLIAAGFAIAFASGAFGIYTNLQPGSLNDSSQSQYWSVFANLARGHWTAPVAVASADPAATVSPPNIDPVVTGTIPSLSAPAPSGIAPQSPEPSSLRAVASVGLTGPPAQTSLDGYFVRDVFDGMALIESRYGLTLVKPGGVLLGAGHVNAIEQQNGKWVVVTTKGTIPYERK